MNEPYTPFEPQIGAAPKSDEKSTIGTETTNPSIKFESDKTHTAARPTMLKTAARATVDKYRGKAEQALATPRNVSSRSKKRSNKRFARNQQKPSLPCLASGFCFGLIFRRR